MQRKDLICLEIMLGLHAQHGGAVLSVSAAMALVLQRDRPKLCQHDLRVGAVPSLSEAAYRYLQSKCHTCVFA